MINLVIRCILKMHSKLIYLRSITINLLKALTIFIMSETRNSARQWKAGEITLSQIWWFLIKEMDQSRSRSRMAFEIPAFVTLQLLLRGYLKSNNQVLYLILRAFAVQNFEMDDIPNKSAPLRAVFLYWTL